jgi:hypothetical protein
MRRIAKYAALTLILSLLASEASAQYAVGHRTFGGGTSFGLGYARMDYHFPDIDPGKIYFLLPTLELKIFLGDKLSLDLSVPVVNIAASNAIQDYFFFTGEAFVNFHPSAPSSWELFVAPGIGFSYASWEHETSGETADGYAFHVPVRIGMELNNQRRNFSVYLAVRPFFSLVHGGSGDNEPGGGAMLEIGLMAYATRFRADRY